MVGRSIAFSAFVLLFIEQAFLGNYAHAEIPKTVLVGYIVNGKEIDSIDTLKQDNTYLLPFSLVIDTLGIAPTEQVNDWQFDTPLGIATLPKSTMLDYQGKPYVRLQSLASLGVSARFVQSSYAIEVNVPWNKGSSSKSKTNDLAKDKSQTIDYYPDTFGLTNLSIDGGYAHQYNQSTASEQSQQFDLNIGMTGHMLSGVWGMQLGYVNDDKGFDFAGSNAVALSNLYWTRTSQHVAFRLGTNRAAYGGIGDSQAYTGLTFAYSNQNVRPHLSGFSSTTHSLISGTSQDLRNIRGFGPAGGIAELRVNGSVIGRVRIALDKRYAFLGLNLNQSDANRRDIEVYLYDFSTAEPPSKIEKINLSKRRANVGTDEFLMEVGVGKKGNHITNSIDSGTKGDQRTFAHGYAEYGLSNNLALRAAVTNTSQDRKHAHRTAGLIGFNAGLTPQINWDLAYRHTPDLIAYESDVHFDSRTISVGYNYHFNRHLRDKGSSVDNEHKTEQAHQLDFYLRPTGWFDVGLSGTVAKKDENIERYASATLNATLYENLRINVRRNRNNGYGYGVYWSLPEYKSHLSFTDDKSLRALYARTSLSPTLGVAGSIRERKNTDGLFYHASASYRLNETNQLRAGYHYHDTATGYDVNWHYKPNQHGSISLGYQSNLSYFAEDDDKRSKTQRDYAYLRFNFLLNKQPARGFRFGHQPIGHYGSIIADIQTDDDAVKDVFDDKVQLTLDNQPVEARKITNGQYIIERVNTGVYELGLPSDSLPIEYQESAKTKPVIKVVNTASTVVPFALKKTLGIAGQLQSKEKGIVVVVYQSDKRIKSTKTNAFGYFQIIGLPAGEYIVQAKGHSPQSVTLTNKILFEIDLVYDELFNLRQINRGEQHD